MSVILSFLRVYPDLCPHLLIYEVTEVISNHQGSCIMTEITGQNFYYITIAGKHKTNLYNVYKST
jgi:hypothetical protein